MIPPIGSLRISAVPPIGSATVTPVGSLTAVTAAPPMLSTIAPPITSVMSFAPVTVPPAPTMMTPGGSVIEVLPPIQVLGSASKAPAPVVAEVISPAPYIVAAPAATSMPCTDFSGKYVDTEDGSSRTLTQTGNTGICDVGWKYTVTGNTAQLKGYDISGKFRDGSRIIDWSNGKTYIPAEAYLAPVTILPTEAVPMATAGVDLNHDGRANVVVTGEDRNRDGIPDVLQQAVPMATAGVDLNHDGRANVVVTGADRNRDGIPDVLQQAVVPMRAPSPMPTGTARYPTYSQMGAIPSSGSVRLSAAPNPAPMMIPAPVGSYAPAPIAAPIGSYVPAVPSVPSMNIVSVAPTSKPLDIGLQPPGTTYGYPQGQQRMPGYPIGLGLNPENITANPNLGTRYGYPLGSRHELQTPHVLESDKDGKFREQNYYLLYHKAWGDVECMVFTDEVRAWNKFKETKSMGGPSMPILLTDKNYEELAYTGMRDVQVDADFRCFWVKAVGNPSQSYRPQPENLPYYHVSPFGVWFDKIVVAFWPHILNFIFAKVKSKLIDIFTTKLQIPFPPELDAGLKEAAKKLAKNPIRLPVSYKWIQSVVDTFWDMLKPVVEKTIPHVIVPYFMNKLPGPLKNIKLHPCTLGNNRPQIKKMRTELVHRETDAGNLETLILSIDVEWKSDLDIMLHGPFNFLEFGAKSVELGLTLHIAIMDLVDAIPLFTGIRAYLEDPIYFAIDWTGAFDILDADCIEKELHTIVNNQVAKRLLVPNAISKVINHHVDGVLALDVKAPRPAGILRIRVISASGLRGDDFSFSSLWTGKRSSDAEVEIRIGAETYKTSNKTTNTRHATWDEDDHYFLIWEPTRQKVDIEIVDSDMASPPDPLARRFHIPIKDFLGIREGMALYGMPTSRHMMIPLHVVWAHKARAGGTHETTLNKLAKKHEDNGHDTQEGFFAKMKGYAKKAYGAVRSEIDSLEEKFEKSTGADPEEWKKLKSRVEIFAQWRPIARHLPYRRPTEGERMLDPVTCVLFVGVVGAHQLPHDADANVTYTAKVVVTPCLKKTMKIPRPGDAGKEAQDQAKLLDDQAKKGTAAGSITTLPTEAEAKEDVKKAAEEKEEKEEEKDKAEAAMKAEAEDSTRETKPVLVSQVELGLTSETMEDETLTMENKYEELKRKAKMLEEKGLKMDEIANLLDVPATFLASDGPYVLNYESAAVWEEGFHFLIGHPHNTEVTITVHKVPSKKKAQGGILAKIEGKGGPPPPELIGTYVFELNHLLKQEHLTSKNFRQPLIGSEGSKVSCFFQLLNYTNNVLDEKQEKGDKTAKGAGKGKHIKTSDKNYKHLEPIRDYNLEQPNKDTSYKGQPDNSWIFGAPNNLIIEQPSPLQLKAPPVAPAPPVPEEAPGTGAPATDAEKEGEHKPSMVDKAKDAVHHAEDAVSGALHSVMGFFHHDSKPEPPKPTPEEKKADLHKKLDDAGLSEFKPAFEENGIDDEHMASQLSDSELNQLGFKMGHVRKFNAGFQKGHDYDVVCPPGLTSMGVGIPYRTEKSTTADVVTYAPFGSIVHGIDQGDGWVKVNALYLPKDVNGYPVLELRGGEPNAPEGSEKAASEAPEETPPPAPEHPGGFSSLLHKVATMMHLEKPSEPPSSKPSSAKTAPGSSSKSSSKATSKATMPKMSGAPPLEPGEPLAAPVNLYEDIVDVPPRIVNDPFGSIFPETIVVPASIGAPIPTEFSEPVVETVPFVPTDVVGETYEMRPGSPITVVRSAEQPVQMSQMALTVPALPQSLSAPIPSQLFPPPVLAEGPAVFPSAPVVMETAYAPSSVAVPLAPAPVVYAPSTTVMPSLSNPSLAPAPVELLAAPQAREAVVLGVQPKATSVSGSKATSQRFMPSARTLI